MTAPRRTERRVVILPTLVTLSNLAAGFLCIAYVGDYVAKMHQGSHLAGAAGAVLMRDGLDRLEMAAWLIFAGMVFDALDGYVARLARAQSDFGVELDSLADVVTFGVAPAFLVKSLIAVEIGRFRDPDLVRAVLQDRIAWLLAAFYVICAALRLARFNVDTSEEDRHMDFTGLPSPAAAAVLAGLTIAYVNLAPDPATGLGTRSIPALLVAYSLNFVVVAVALAMVSKVRYFHFVNVYLRQRRPVANLFEALLVVVLIVLIPQVVVPLAACAYALSGPVYTLHRMAQRRRRARAGEGEPREDAGAVEGASA